MTYEVRARFESREEAEVFRELVSGLCADKPYLWDLNSKGRQQRKRLLISQTRLGKTVLGLFVQGRSKHCESIRVELAELGWSENSARTTLSRLSREGKLEQLGDGYYELSRMSG